MARHTSWKKSRKTKAQYRRIPYITLYRPYEHNECGFVITEKEIDELAYIWDTYRPLLFPHLVPTL